MTATIKMNVGISTASLFLKENNENAVKLFSDWGIDCAEIFLTSFCEYDPVFAETLKQNMGDLRVHSVHVLSTQLEPQLYAVHPRVKADAFSWLEKVMCSARVLGADHYTFHGIARIKRTFRENLPFAAERTREIFEFCKNYGVRLCYENVEWSLYSRPEIFTALKKQCPQLGGVLDIKQARIAGYDYRQFLEEMGSNLTHVHVSDVTTDGKMCLPGRGEFNFDELFSRLKEVGFTGAVLIENYAGDFGDENDLKEAYFYLKEKASRFF